MKNICLYFQIHHPFSFQTFRFFDIGKSKSYYDDFRINMEINEAVENFYLPVNDFLLKLIEQSNGKLKLSFNISGTTLDQFLMFAPKVLTSFRQLADTGHVEFMGGTSSHSIASLAESNDEFKDQIIQNMERIEYYFGQKPKIFVNTDLLFTNQMGKIAFESGYPAVLTNGTNKILQWRSPNYLYSGENHEKFKILFRNDLISNEFSDIIRNSFIPEKPVLLKQLFTALHSTKKEEPMVNIYLNYITLGGKDRLSKMRFFKFFTTKIVKSQSFKFSLPSELLERFGAIAEIGTEEPVCWTEHFHSSYYPGNDLQRDSLHQLFKLDKQVVRAENSNIKIDWQYLQTSDHFHLMDENHPAYHDQHSITSIYKSKYDAYINYMNILEDFRHRLATEKARHKFELKISQQPIHKPLRVRDNHQYHDF